MPAFQPFRAVRYAASHDLAAVTAPPYDVLSDADVDALAALDPHNIVRVDVPRRGEDRYSEAAITLFQAKVDSNAENTVGIMTMASKGSAPLPLAVVCSPC